MKTALPALLIIVLAAACIWAAGIRVVSIPPMMRTPEGRTLIVSGLHGRSLVTSPVSYCANIGGSPACRARALMEMSRDGVVLVRLPYFDFIEAMAGD